MESAREMSVFEEAERLVGGARKEEYGELGVVFKHYAMAWSGVTGKDFTAQDVARCMIALKLCRDGYRAKRDNRVDAAGYLLILDQLSD